MRFLRGLLAGVTDYARSQQLNSYAQPESIGPGPAAQSDPAQRGWALE